MTEGAAVFEKTYNDYLARLSDININGVALRLGATVEGDEAVMPLLSRAYRISKTGIARKDGGRPQLGTCVILSRYLLMCPAILPIQTDWASFRDFKDSGPLTVYWATEVEGAIADAFAGRVADLEKAADSLGGYAPDDDFPYDVCRRFNALPKIPMLLLFNDADEEFPAKCTVLFQAGAEDYLDGECLAMLGAQLAGRLERVLKKIA